ncbi:MAG: TlpA disulfide reductase family protein [Pseudomonadota bacterium]
MARHWSISKGALGAGIGLALVFGVALFAGTQSGGFTGLFKTPQCRASAAIGEAVAPLAVGAMQALETFDPVDVSELPFDTTRGTETTIAELPEEVSVFNLWATWCAPCREEMPHLAALQEARGGQGMNVVAVSIDNNDRNRPEAFLAETNATALAYYREPTLRLFNSLRAAGLVVGMPTTLLVGPDGCTSASLAGAADWGSEEAIAVVDAAVTASR